MNKNCDRCDCNCNIKWIKVIVGLKLNNSSHDISNRAICLNRSASSLQLCKMDIEEREFEWNLKLPRRTTFVCALNSSDRVFLRLKSHAHGRPVFIHVRHLSIKSRRAKSRIKLKARYFVSFVIFVEEKKYFEIFSKKKKRKKKEFNFATVYNDSLKVRWGEKNKNKNCASTALGLSDRLAVFFFFLSLFFPWRDRRREFSPR